MTTTLHPSWTIQGVFDPDHGVDFAYTIGLAELTGIELHMWCQPTDGSDPGDGFRLSLQDMGHMLNRFGARFVDGTLSIGATVTEQLDAGLTQVTVTFTGPVDASTVDAFGAQPHPVVRADWTLSRSRLDLDDERATAEALNEAEVFRRRHATATGVDLPIPTLGHGLFGPRSPVVETLVTAIDATSDDDLFAMVLLGAPANHHLLTGQVLGVSASAARATSRSEAYDTALAVADELAERRRHVPDEDDVRDAWTTTCRQLLSALLGVAVVTDALDVIDDDTGAGPSLRQASRGFFDCVAFSAETHQRTMEHRAVRDVMARARRRDGWVERTTHIEEGHRAEIQALEATSWAAAQGFHVDPWRLLVSFDGPLLRRLAAHPELEGSPLSWLAACLEAVVSGYHASDDLLRACGLRSRSRARAA